MDLISQRTNKEWNNPQELERIDGSRDRRDRRQDSQNSNSDGTTSQDMIPFDYWEKELCFSHERN